MATLLFPGNGRCKGGASLTSEIGAVAPKAVPKEWAPLDPVPLLPDKVVLVLVVVKLLNAALNTGTEHEVLLL
jgi:hypothetical protein